MDEWLNGTEGARAGKICTGKEKKKKKKYAAFSMCFGFVCFCFCGASEAHLVTSFGFVSKFWLRLGLIVFLRRENIWDMNERLFHVFV